MHASLQQAITTRLMADYHFEPHPPWLQRGRCPACGKKELFTHAEHPWVLRCGRLNRCGWIGEVKDWYPDLFNHWSERFPSLDNQPQAAADAYLQYARGFDLARLRGWYTQEYYYDTKLKAGSATVRFAVGNTFWERLIDQPDRLGKKAHFQPGGHYAGMWWQPPTLDLTTVKALWLVEGIFDAIALDHHGIAAVALLSCTNYPEQALAELARHRPDDRPRLIWALDHDRAGQHGMVKGVRRAREAGWTCEAAQISPSPFHVGKRDWNDLHQGDQLTEAHISEYRYHGALLIAESALEKARCMYQHTPRREFPLDYENRLYWFKVDAERLAHALEQTDELQALEEASGLVEIANCLPRALYYQANPLTDEAWYYFRVEGPQGQTVKNTFTGAQLACASEFKKRLLSIAPGAFYTGNRVQLDRYLKQQMAGIRSVSTLDFIGYSREHGAYVFNDLAVKQGRIYERNEEDYFALGALNLKTLNAALTLTIHHAPQADPLRWFEALWSCFGAKGLIALAFWLGSLFAEQLRAQYKSFPFLEIVGEPGAGKSTLIEFLWKLLGRRDYEGFDPSKSSLAARARNFAQVAGLPVVLVEGERREETKYPTFDWEELKTAYNGRSIRAMGIKTGGNETREPLFRGALVISQNSPVMASEAILQRLISLSFDRATQTPHTKQQADTLARLPVETVSGFILEAITREATLLKTIHERFPVHEQELQALPALHNFRIAKNHAQIKALVEALSLFLPVTAAQTAHAQTQLNEMAIERQRTINADHPLVQEFWEIFDYLEGAGLSPRLNHAREAQLIAVNLNQFATLAAEQRQQIPPLIELKRLLRTSKKRRFIEIKAVNSAIRARDPARQSWPATVKCWVFQRH